MDSWRAMLINSKDKKETYKMNYYILHTFLLVTLLLLIMVTICYYCIKHQSKQKNKLPY